jgi:hypothetical protein
MNDQKPFRQGYTENIAFGFFTTPRPQRTARAALVHSRSTSAPYIGDTASEVRRTKTHIHTFRNAKLQLAPCSWHDLYHIAGRGNPFQPLPRLDSGIVTAPLLVQFWTSHGVANLRGRGCPGSRPRLTARTGFSVLDSRIFQKQFEKTSKCRLSCRSRKPKALHSDPVIQWPGKQPRAGASQYL